MNIFLATDHDGFELKEKVKAFLMSGDRALKYTVIDCGAETYDALDDYPVIISKAARAVSENLMDKAIVFGTSGQGEAIVSNRFPGVRAVVWYGGSPEVSHKIITLSREHNDANILSIGAGFVNIEEACAMVDLWLTTVFSSEERHLRRINQIDL